MTEELTIVHTLPFVSPVVLDTTFWPSYFSKWKWLESLHTFSSTFFFAVFLNGMMFHSIKFFVQYWQLGVGSFGRTRDKLKFSLGVASFCKLLLFFFAFCCIFPVALHFTCEGWSLLSSKWKNFWSHLMNHRILMSVALLLVVSTTIRGWGWFIGFNSFMKKVGLPYIFYDDNDSPISIYWKLVDHIPS